MEYIMMELYFLKLPVYLKRTVRIADSAFSAIFCGSWV